MMKPPIARKIARELRTHGDVRIDEYYWLRERDNPEVLEYLRRENEYTGAAMRDTESFREDLYREMLARIKETDLSVPVPHGDYVYYSRTEQGKQYSIYCRKSRTSGTGEEILLDLNVLAGEKGYLRLGVFEISPAHDLLAYSIDTDGSETYTLRFRDLRTGIDTGESIENTYYSLSWANDNRTAFYTVLDRQKRPYIVFRHTPGTDPAGDVKIYHEPDEAFFIWLTKTRSKKYILLNIESHTTSEVRYLDADTPLGDFRLFAPRKVGVEYLLYHGEGTFFVLTNEHAVNFKLLEMPEAEAPAGNRTEAIPHRPEVKIDSIDLFKNHIVVYERRGGFRTIRIAGISDRVFHTVEFSEPVYTVFEGENPEYESDVLRFQYSSLITPLSVYDYHMRDRTLELKKRSEVLGDYDSGRYSSERLYAPLSDGTEIPISIVYRKDIGIDGMNPLLLYGYGAYGISMDPSFASTRLSLLDRGFIYAIAHIRGGGEFGRPWYEAGKLMHKKNTFADFIACAEYLVARKYTSKDLLVAMGGSAGGMLIGAVLNLRPDLFKAAVAKVPFVDTLTTMLDSSVPLTVIEYEEWGNPNRKEFYDYIKSYSPYDNVAPQRYPHLLVIAGLNDPRVQYWESAKWTAKLRAVKADRNLLLLKTDMGVGHGGASGRYDYLRDIAFEYDFIFSATGRRDLL